MMASREDIPAFLCGSEVRGQGSAEGQTLSKLHGCVCLKLKKSHLQPTPPIQDRRKPLCSDP